MKTKLLYSIIFFTIAQFVYGQEGKYNADKFVAKCPNELFIGSIVELKSINQDTYKILDAAINPITIGYQGISIKSQELAPSYDNMMTALRNALKADDVLKSNYNFSFAIKEIKSYEELAINWGQQINPQTLLGVRPGHKPNKTMVLVDISQSFFSIDMDIPETLSTDPQVLQRPDELIYVNSLQFGRKVTILIESHTEYHKLKEMIDDLLKGKALDEKGNSILANSTVRVIAIGKNDIEEVNPNNPFTSVLNYFSRKVTPDDFGAPISFTASHIKDNSVFANQFSF